MMTQAEQSMVQVTHSVVIDTPIPEVFAYLDRPENHQTFDPCVSRAEMVTMLPNGGKRIAYTYTMAGVDLDGHREAVRYAPESHIRWSMSGDFTGTIDWMFDPLDDRTRFSITAMYTLPSKLTEAMTESAFARYNEHRLEQAFENLRTLLEHDPDA